VSATIERRLHAAEAKARARQALARTAAVRQLPTTDKARGSLLAFAKRMHAGYADPTHVRLVAEHLEAVECGRIDRLIVTMPPRHGKSLLVSELFAPWFVGRDPDRRVIAASHTAQLAYTFSRRARNRLADPRWPFPAVRIAPDLGAVQSWDIAGCRGGYIAAGVGGPITGHGADLLLVDDPIKSAADADSETMRNALWEWFTATAATRLEPGGRIIVVATRWHEDDLIGRLLRGSHRWQVLGRPAIGAAGAALWPERFPVAALDAIRREVGARVWNAQYLNRPSPPAGTVFKRQWFRTYDQRPALRSFDAIVQSWDMTFRETKTGSYVVGQVWGAIAADRYLLDQFRERVDFPGALAAVRRMSATWPESHEKLVEDKANGPAIVATLRSEIPGLIEVSPEGGKVARANAVSWQVEAGNVYLPAPELAPWVDGFLEECAGFPTAAHDDQVDAMSQALLRLTRSAGTFERLPDGLVAVLQELGV